MRTEANISTVSLRAKAWYTKFQQELPTIRETRLPDLDEKTDIYGDLRIARLVIRALDFGGLPLTTRSELADFLVGKMWQIATSKGQSYVEENYDFDDDYVMVEQ